MRQNCIKSDNITKINLKLYTTDKIRKIYITYMKLDKNMTGWICFESCDRCVNVTGFYVSYRGGERSIIKIF